MLYTEEEVQKQRKLVKFSEEASLGKVVSERALVCQLGVSPIRDLERQLQFACGFDKLGFLCGFRFISSFPESRGKRFYVVFVPKLKSSIMRQQARGRSSWYVWEWNSSTDVNVLSQDATMKKFGFDIDLFFNSDLFKAAIPKFLKAIRKALDTDIPEKIEADQVDALLARDLKRYMRAIEDSLKTLASGNASSTFNLGGSADGQTKIYRASHSYELDHFQKRAREEAEKAKEEEAKKAKDGFLAWLAARNQKIAAQQKADGGGNEA